MEDPAANGEEALRTERIAPDSPRVEKAPTDEVQLLADDYDTWCETGTICTRELSDYISETKGNAAYGNSSGAIGSFDIVLRTNLNGRQAQWRTTWIHDTGPALSFSSAYIRCSQLGSIFSCGTHAADNGDAFINLGTGRYGGPLVYGNRLTQSAQYQGRVTGNFVPSGYPGYTMAALYSQVFNCYGTGNRYFP